MDTARFLSALVPLALESHVGTVSAALGWQFAAKHSLELSTDNIFSGPSLFVTVRP